MTENNASQNTNDMTTKSSIEETLSINNIRIAVVGNVYAGKSTLIGTLRTSQLDDGRGSSRISIMKHRHEIETGRTSTATSHILGFHEDGALIKGRDTLRHNRLKSEDEIVKESNKLITFSFVLCYQDSDTWLGIDQQLTMIDSCLICLLRKEYYLESSRRAI